MRLAKPFTMLATVLLLGGCGEPAPTSSPWADAPPSPMDVARAKRMSRKLGRHCPAQDTRDVKDPCSIAYLAPYTAPAARGHF